MNFIPVNEPLLNGNEKKYLNECIDTGWISSEGPFVEKLEKGMAVYVGRKHGIAVCNGSVALELVVEVLNFEQGDEIIMPSFTIISCIAPLVRRGIVPVLVDSCKETWNMDVEQIEAKITSKTKAIMVVHIYGITVDMDKVIEIANRYDLIIIEDSAEAHGLKYKENQCGSFGLISIMSFYPNKHITTGEGGMVLTDDDALADRCRLFRNLCHKPGQRFVHEELGYNFRMSNIQAAVGVAQLERLEQHIIAKREMGKKYTEALRGCKGLTLPVEKENYCDNIYWVFGMVIEQNSRMTAKAAMEFLAEQGIGTRPFFYPMHMQPVLQKKGLFLGEKYPVAEWLANKGFYVPSSIGITNEEIGHVVEAVRGLSEIL